MEQRLQKLIAAAGVASRRHAEEMIQAGLVSVNGEIVTTLGSKADPAKDTIKVNNKVLEPKERPLYLVLNKPKGYVTTVSDPEGRETVMDLIGEVGVRVYPVGRLDYLSEGLVLLTNDGALTQKLMHASSHVPKTYLVKVSGQPSEQDIDKLRQGIALPPGPERGEEKRRAAAVRTAPAQIELSKSAENPWYEVTIIEGRNRQIRRMFEEIGHHVEKIKRIRYGPLKLDLESGQSRALKPSEIAALKDAVRPGAKRFEPEKTSRVQRRASSTNESKFSRSPKSSREPWKRTGAVQGGEETGPKARREPRSPVEGPGGVRRWDESGNPIFTPKRRERPQGDWQGRSASEPRRPQREDRRNEDSRNEARRGNETGERRPFRSNNRQSSERSPRFGRSEGPWEQRKSFGGPRGEQRSSGFRANDRASSEGSSRSAKSEGRREQKKSFGGPRGERRASTSDNRGSFKRFDRTPSQDAPLSSDRPQRRWEPRGRPQENRRQKRQNEFGKTRPFKSDNRARNDREGSEGPRSGGKPQHRWEPRETGESPREEGQSERPPKRSAFKQFERAGTKRPKSPSNPKGRWVPRKSSGTPRDSEPRNESESPRSSRPSNRSASDPARLGAKSEGRWESNRPSTGSRGPRRTNDQRPDRKFSRPRRDDKRPKR